MTDYSGAELAEMLERLVEERRALCEKAAEAERELEEQRREPTEPVWDPEIRTFRQVPTGFPFPSMDAMRAFSNRMAKLSGEDQCAYIKDNAEAARLHDAVAYLIRAGMAQSRLERFDRFIEGQLNGMPNAKVFFNAIGSHEFASFASGFRSPEILKKKVKKLHASAVPIVRCFFDQSLSIDEIKQRHPQALSEFFGCLSETRPLWLEIEAGERPYWKVDSDNETDLTRVLQSQRVADARFGKEKDGSSSAANGAAMLVAMILDGPGVWRKVLTWSGHDGKK